MSRSAAVLVSRATLLALILSAAAACEGLTIDIHLQVGLSVSPDSADSGLIVTMTFSNRGEVVVESERDRFEFSVVDSSGFEIRRLAGPSGAGRLHPGESVAAAWDQKDKFGMQVPSGDYKVLVRYRAGGTLRTEASSFTIV